MTELGFDETASGITSSLLKKFEEDQILDKVRKNMVAFVSGNIFHICNIWQLKGMKSNQISISSIDGAPVMIGRGSKQTKKGKFLY